MVLVTSTQCAQKLSVGFLWCGAWRGDWWPAGLQSPWWLGGLGGDLSSLEHREVCCPSAALQALWCWVSRSGPWISHAPCYLCQFCFSLKKKFFFFKFIWLPWVLVVAHKLSCSATHGILFPRPGMEPVSPALQGGFLTTGPPGRSLRFILT